MRCPECEIEMRIEHPLQNEGLFHFFCRNPACSKYAKEKDKKEEMQ